MKSPESTLNDARAQRGQGDALALMPYGIVITSTDSHSEEVKYEGPRGGSPTPVTHPYLGPNSWIRVMPESRTTAIMGTRGEDGEPFIQAYVQETNLENKSSDLPTVTATEEEKFHYRALREGEIDIMSRGVAGSFYSRGGNLELRGGATSMSFDAFRIETRMRAPTHQRAILGNKRQEVGNEERFGVVRRPNSLSDRVVTNATIQDIISVEPPTVAGLVGGISEHAKEYLRIIKAENGETLVDHREGNVIDDDGTDMESDITGNKLRHRSKYGTKLSEETVFEIDEEGNVTLTVPTTATKGAVLNVGSGPMVGTDLEITIARDTLLSVGKTIIIDALQNIDISTKTKLTIDAIQEIEFTGAKFTANNILVALAQGADNPAVLGNMLVQWLTSHTHPTAVGPSGPPVQIPTLPTILSSVVTLK